MIPSPFANKHICFAVKARGEEKDYPLPAEELACLSPHAIERRRQEFTLGRAAAHQALGSLLGRPAPPLLKGTHGEPLWPDRIVGAITHSSGWAMAAVSRQEHCAGVGIDLEARQRRVTPGISRLICLPAEQSWIDSEEGEAEIRLKMIFSAKESIFKAFFPREKVFLTFKDAELQWDFSHQLFQARLNKRAGYHYPAGYEFQVGCTLLPEHILTFTTLPDFEGEDASLRQQELIQR